MFGGAPAESISEFEIMVRLGPLDPAAWAILGQRALAHYAARHYEAARETADKALVERLDLAGPRVVKAAALVRLGQVAEAAKVLADVPRIAFFQLPFNCRFRNNADWSISSQCCVQTVTAMVLRTPRCVEAGQAAASALGLTSTHR